MKRRHNVLPVWRVMYHGLPIYEVAANTPEAAIWAAQVQMVAEGIISPWQQMPPLHGVYAKAWK